MTNTLNSSGGLYSILHVAIAQYVVCSAYYEPAICAG